MDPRPTPRNTPRVAAALRYRRGRDVAPVVTATGHGAFAEALVRRALEAGVPLHDDAALAASLARLPVPSVLPPELYAAVAEILAWIHRRIPQDGAP